MNKILFGLAGGLVGAVLSVGPAALAANSNLTNGGLGQRAGDTTNFGVAVCNNGSAELAASVPVFIMVNGNLVTTQSPAPIAANSCGYAYVPYQTLGMAGGSSYSVDVSIDGNAQSTYTVTAPVPGLVLGASTTGEDQNTINLMLLQIQLLQSLVQKLQALLALQGV